MNRNSYLGHMKCIETCSRERVIGKMIKVLIQSYTMRRCNRTHGFGTYWPRDIKADILHGKHCLSTYAHHAPTKCTREPSGMDISSQPNAVQRVSCLAAQADITRTRQSPRVWKTAQYESRRYGKRSGILRPQRRVSQHAPCDCSPSQIEPHAAAGMGVMDRSQDSRADEHLSGTDRPSRPREGSFYTSEVL